MADDYPFRLYALLEATPALKEIYSPDNLDDLTLYTRKLFKQTPYSRSKFASAQLIKGFTAVGAPSKDWTPAFVGAENYPAPKPDELIVAFGFDDPARQREFIDLVADGQSLAPCPPIRQVGVDIGVDSADHWCPGQGSLGAFGHRADARRTVNAAALGLLTGQNVNVVIIDEGLNQAAIKPANWGGGLNWNGIAGFTPLVGSTVSVGTADRTSHGMMVARGILDLAPSARLYDVPLLPKRIGQIPAFLSSANAAYQTILAYIALHRNDNAQWKGPWILVNAWAIFDRETESPTGLPGGMTLGDYTENKQASGHPLINTIKGAVASSFDVIFAAGNCGEFCFNQRCGKQDRGPGHSIWGANALSEVITVGAVRSDEMWTGYSSQGPGPGINGLATQKPDLCAPSNFCEDRDAHVQNSGTSAACAMTAGVVAALRSNPAWSQALRSPAQMLSALTLGARKTHGAGWDGRFGNGILDVRGTMIHL